LLSSIAINSANFGEDCVPRKTAIKFFIECSS
jgi:hypothetical protein